MSIWATFHRWIGDAERVAENVIHTEEKELEMALSQAFTDALARIQAALAAHSNQGAADAQTIAALQSDKAALRGQLADAQAQNAALTQQLAEEEAAVVAIVPDPSTVPAPAPAADGSGSADVTP